MLDKLVNNPFRILGVYSNAKPAEIVSNCDEMEAYLGIGQNVSFDLDYDNVLPAVNRTEQTVQQAKQQINLPKEKLKYALFWFFKDSCSAHAMNHLKNGDCNSADSVFEMEESFSSRINQAVVAMMRDDLGAAIAYLTDMIHDDDFRNGFVEAICGQAFSIDEDSMSHLFIESLLEEVDDSELLDLFQEHGTSVDDDNYLKKKVVEKYVSKINIEIGEAKNVEQDDAEANYRAGKALIQHTKNKLKKVRNLLGTSDMKYQMIADDLAKAILQCGINYYNNTDDDDDIDKAMELQKYACSIAVGSMCKDICNQNLTILEKKKDEKAVGVDVVFIANQLKAFQTKSDTIDNARNLVVNCKPHLDIIKNQLGSQNETYLQISTAVANNALGMIVTVINNAQNISSSPYLYSSQLTNLKSKIDSAINVMNLIGGLDMKSAERSHYNTNKSSLNNIKSQVDAAWLSNISGSTSSYGSSSGGYYPTSSSGGGGDNTNWGCIIFGIIAFIIFIIIMASQ